jgi:predicted DNA-binding protein YlxM (UPF0122 family)
MCAMAKDLVLMSRLYDLYGGMLTEKQRELFTLYYEEDLSLAEISQNEGITRQGVRDAIVRAEETLKSCDERMGLAEKFAAMQDGARAATAAAYQIGEINRTRYFDTRIENYLKQISDAMRVLE